MKSVQKFQETPAPETDSVAGIWNFRLYVMCSVANGLACSPLDAGHICLPFVKAWLGLRTRTPGRSIEDSAKATQPLPQPTHRSHDWVSSGRLVVCQPLFLGSTMGDWTEARPWHRKTLPQPRNPKGQI